MLLQWSEVLEAQKLVSTLLVDEGSGRVPVPVFEIARRLGVGRFEAVSMGFRGALVRDSDGALVIRYLAKPSSVSDKIWRRQVRFSVAHEVGHLIFDRVRGYSPGTGVAYCTDRPVIEERYADLLAADILLPKEALSRSLTGRPSGWKSLDTIAGIFQVSRSALIQRLVHELRGMVAIHGTVVVSKNQPARRIRCSCSPGWSLSEYSWSLLRDSSEVSSDRCQQLTVPVHASSESLDVTVGVQVVKRKQSTMLRLVGWNRQPTSSQSENCCMSIADDSYQLPLEL